MQREAARAVLGVNDAKSRLAQVLRDHAGEAGIIFDQQDAFVHVWSIDQSMRVAHAINRDASAPRDPRSRHPVRDFLALLRIEHLGDVGQGLRDALARGVREGDLLRAQPLDCSTIDGRCGQERDRLGARGLRLLAQRAQVGDRGLGDAGDLGLLVGVASSSIAMCLVMRSMRSSICAGVSGPPIRPIRPIPPIPPMKPPCARRTPCPNAVLSIFPVRPATSAMARSTSTNTPRRPRQVRVGGGLGSGSGSRT